MGHFTLAVRCGSWSRRSLQLTRALGQLDEGLVGIGVVGPVGLEEGQKGCPGDLRPVRSHVAPLNYGHNILRRLRRWQPWRQPVGQAGRDEELLEVRACFASVLVPAESAAVVGSGFVVSGVSRGGESGVWRARERAAKVEASGGPLVA